MWQLISSVFLGWALGANDASNVFGTAVASKMLRFWTAALFCSLFVFLGAWLGGAAGMETYSSLSSTTLNTAFIVSFASAMTVTVMTLMQLPVSTSQAVVGALTAVGVLGGNLDIALLVKVVACWVGTPIGGMIIAAFLYILVVKKLLRLIFN